MQQLTIGDISIDVVRKNIKNIHLAVYPPTGRVRLAAPLAAQEDVIRLYAISKLSWIKRHQRNFEEQERIPPREYKQRESHYYQGRRYLLRIIESDQSPKVVLRNKKYLELHIKPNSNQKKCHELLTKWYRKELKELIPPLIDKWEKILKVRLSGWQIKQMKTKWGSCNIEKKTILLNLELAKKQLHCLEYIIVHEMMHLHERHHNERFLGLMEKYMPLWKTYREELNRLPTSYGK